MSAHAPAGARPGEKHLFECPLCGGESKLDVTRKHDDTGWWMRCWSTRCPEGGEYLRALAEVVGAANGGMLLYEPLRYLEGATTRIIRRAVPDPLPSAAMVAGWSCRLHADTEALAYLTEERGLTVATVKHYELGFDGRAITLPIYGENGELANLRRRFLSPASEAPKYVGVRGRSSQLYPGLPESRTILLVEGEFDALLTRQHGFPAVTSTAGTSWCEAWDERVAYRRIAVVYDAGARSWGNAVRRAAQLNEAGAREAWAVDLRQAGLRRGEDLTDWFLRYQYSPQSLRTLIRRAQRSRNA